MRKDSELLAARIRGLFQHHDGYSERKMFGGVCFMLNGNMCVAPWKDHLMVRLPKDQHEQTQSDPHAKPMDITGKVMKGWALIEPDGIETAEGLDGWIQRAVEFVETLPAK